MANGKPATTRGTNSGMKQDSELYKFFVDAMKDIYWAEKHLTKALPKMIKAASSEQLQTAIEDHLEQTKGHVTRLENVFEMLGQRAQAKKCEAMEGLLKECDSIVEETEEGTATRDAAVIMAAQKVEHYEIATYGTLRTYAETLGFDEQADLLQETLDEEKDTDDNLTELAVSCVNLEAEGEEAEEEGEEEEEEEGESQEEKASAESSRSSKQPARRK